MPRYDRCCCGAVTAAAIHKQHNAHTMVAVLRLLRPQNKHKSTALMIACQENNIAVAKILLAYSADLGKQDVHGATAIMRACFVADGAPLVALLLQMCPGDKHQLVNMQVRAGTGWRHANHCHGPRALTLSNRLLSGA